MLSASIFSKRMINSFVLFSLLFSSFIQAKEIEVLGITMLENSDRDKPLTVFIDDTASYAFMDPSSDKEETFLFDLKKSLVYSIDHADKVVVEMDMLPKFVPDKRLSALSSKSMSDVLSIDGYKASRYDVNVANKLCMSVFSSTTLNEVPGVSAFFGLYGRVLKFGNVSKVFKSLKSKEKTRYCVYSKEYIYKKIATKGVPVKLEENGKTVLEIISIKKGQIGDDRMFLIPKAYRQTSMREQLIKAAGKNSK